MRQSKTYPGDLKDIWIYPAYQEAQRSFNDYKMVNEAIFSSSGSKLLVGGFGLCGIPENLIGGLVKSGAK